MAITLPELPYSKDALEPYISAKTLEFHHDKHHNAYVVNGNKLLEGSGLENLSQEEIIKRTAGDQQRAGIFNNVGQVWNHTFYWNSMKKNGGGKPQGEIAERINRDFGSYEKFAEDFKNAGITQFGSGWAWLVLNGDKLEIMKTLNADNPIAHNMKPLMTADVWEHAYYLDYQNRRPDYLTTFLDNLVNWEFVNQNLKK